MSKKIKWGILGTGFIANQFVKGLQSIENAEIYAVGSRSQESADAFGEKYGATKTYGSYEALANDPEVDVVYIATPHPYHYENSILCMNAGKNVLCEKPLTLNAKTAAKMIEYAKEKNVFFMEAVWSRFLPVYDELRKWIQSGAIGDIHLLKADFGYHEPWPAEDRHVNPNLAGGVLLDIGVYLVSFAQFVFGEKPKDIKTIKHMGQTGVDVDEAMLFDYGMGKMAMLFASINVNMPHDAYIYGSKGCIHIKDFWHPVSAALLVNGEEPKVVEMRFKATGYEFEAMAVMKCLEEGKKTCDLMPLEQTLEVLEVMDAIRKDWGFVYPMEEV
jgi:dihydrodiol dehydrogenase / D-xylose 1-dehydrogenase (NADP)